MSGNIVFIGKKIKKQYGHLGLALLIPMLLSACGSGNGSGYSESSTEGTATIMCDNSFENIMQQEIDVFEYIYPKAHILARYLPQKEAIDSLLEFKTRMIVIARDLSTEEKEYLQAHKIIYRSKKIAVDALALVVNKDNPVEMLSVDEIGDILAGELKNWNDLEPSDLGQINIIFDDEFSSTVQYMQDSLMNGRKFGDNVFAQKSIDGVFKAVQANKNAIGVIGVSWITTDMRNHEASIEEIANEVKGNAPAEGSNPTFDTSIKVLKVLPSDSTKVYKAYKPYQQNIYDGTYPLFRQIYMITTGVNGTLSHGFYTFVTGQIGQKIILKTGVLPASMSLQVVEIND